MISIARTFAIASLIVGVFARAALAADPTEVFIDARDPAFLVVQGVAADTPAEALREMTGYATLEGVSLVGWEAFRQNAQELIGPHIVKDEYPGSALVPSVVALVKTYPGRSFAVTWNGGLAVSFQDFQYAVESRKAFNDDADAYERNRAQALNDDPLNPRDNLAALLNR
jgi:hypothetical protein